MGPITSPSPKSSCYKFTFCLLGLNPFFFHSDFATDCIMILHRIDSLHSFFLPEWWIAFLLLWIIISKQVTIIKVTKTEWIENLADTGNNAKYSYFQKYSLKLKIRLSTYKNVIQVVSNYSMIGNKRTMVFRNRKEQTQE